MKELNFLARKAFAQKTGLVQQPDGRIFIGEHEFIPETCGGDELRLVVALDIPAPVCDANGVRIGDFFEKYQAHEMNYHFTLMAATLKFAANLTSQ